MAFILPVFLFWGCIKNEVKVDFQLPENVNDAYKLTYYASDQEKGWFVETVAAVQRGKVEVVLATKLPTIVYIMESGSMPRAAFYAERGDKIEISGDSNDPLSWNISGNDLTEEWSKWRVANRTALASGEYPKINKAVGEYVKSNPGNPLSTILLLVYYDRRSDDSGFLKLWKLLKEKALEPKWMQLVSRSDIIRESPLSPQKIGSLILHTYGNGVDTLMMGNKPVLMFFWRGNDDKRKEGIDMIKGLVKAFPDSASRIIADISFDPDSIGWQSAVRKDSLSKVVRGWNFHGETDSLMIRSGVERTPWFIVFDSKGKEVYAGDDHEKADKKFRNLLKTP